MNAQNPESKLNDTLNSLAEKLGVKAGELFEATLKQAKIELRLNTVYLVFNVLTFIGGIYLVFYVYPFWVVKEVFPVAKQTVVLLLSVAW